MNEPTVLEVIAWADKWADLYERCTILETEENAAMITMFHAAARIMRASQGTDGEQRP